MCTQFLLEEILYPVITYTSTCTSIYTSGWYSYSQACGYRTLCLSRKKYWLASERLLLLLNFALYPPELGKNQHPSAPRSSSQGVGSCSWCRYARLKSTPTTYAFAFGRDVPPDLKVPLLPPSRLRRDSRRCGDACGADCLRQTASSPPA